MRQIILFFCSLILCAAAAAAQSPNLPYTVSRYIYFGHYAQAQDAAEQALTVTQPGTPEHTLALVQMGYVHLTYARYKLADSTLTAAIDLWDKNATVRDSNYLQAYTWLATAVLNLAQYKRADMLLTKAESIGAALNGTVHEAALTNVWLVHVELDAILARWGDATYHFDRLFKLETRIFKKNDPRRAIGLTALAHYHLNNTWDWRAAKDALAQAEKIITPLQKSSPLEYSKFLQAKADLYLYEMSRYKEGEALLVQAMQYTETTLGTQHAEYLGILRSLASCWEYYTPKIRQAKALYTTALAGFTANFGEYYPNRVGTLQNLAEWESNQGFNSKATVLRREALAVCRQIYGDDHPSTASLMLAVAGDLTDEGKYPQVKKMIDSAEAIYNRCYPNPRLHPSRISILNKRSSILTFGGKRTDQIALHEEATTIAKELYGPQSPRFWSVKSNLANTLSWQVANSDKQKADSLFREVLLFRAAYYGTKNLGYGAWLSIAAYSSKKIGKKEEAIQYVEQAIRITEEAIGRDNNYYLRDISHLLDLYIDIKPEDTVTIKNLLSQQKTIAQRIFGDTSSAYVDYLDNQIGLSRQTTIPAISLKLQRQRLTLERLLGGSQLFIVNVNSLAFQLIAAGEYVEAKQLLQEGVQLCQTDYGTQSDQYLFSLWTISQLYGSLGQYDSTALYLDAWEAAIADMGNSEDWLSYFYSAKALHYRDVGNYKEAEKWKTKEFQLPNASPNSGDYNVMGLILDDQEHYPEADSLYQLAIKLARSDNQDTSYLVNNRAVIQANIGHYDRALAMLSGALRDTEVKNGPDDLQMATLLKNMGSTLMDADRYAEADSFLRLAGAIILTKNGSNHPDYASFLNTRAVLYSDTDRFEEEEKALREAMSIAEKRLGTRHPSYLLYKSNYADYLALTGQSKAADSIYLELLVAYEQSANGTAFHANVLQHYAIMLRNIGQYDKAIQLGKQALAILTSIYPHDSEQRAGAISTLGLIYTDKKDYEQALQTYQKALTTLERLQLSENTQYATVLYRMAGIEQTFKRYADSETHYKKSLLIRERVLGPEHSVVGLTLEFMARLYLETNRLPEAASVVRRCLAIQEKAYGLHHVNYAYPLLLLGQIMIQQGNAMEGQQALATAQAVLLERIQYMYAYLPTSHQVNVSDQYRMLINSYPTLAITHPSPALAGMCYDNALLIKGAALQNSRNLREIVAQDTLLQKDFEEYLTLQRQIAELYRYPNPAQLVKIQERATQLERSLAARSPAYQQYLSTHKITWRTVQQQLQPGKAAIEYIRFNCSNASGKDTFAYAALVLRSEWEAPKFVYLCEERVMKNSFNDNSLRKSTYVEAIYGDMPRSGEESNPTIKLYDLLWKPLEIHLQGVKDIEWAGAGLLNRINIQALSDDKTNYLLNKYKFTQLRSTRLLCDKSPAPAYGKDALLYGGIKFNDSTLPSIVRGKTFESLPNTEAEMNSAEIRLKSHDFRVTWRKDTDATAGAFIKDCQHKPSPRVIAAATHGFFDSDSLARNDKINPLSRSGLVFAGSEKISAQEIAQLDLHDTELVILSACDSGLGDLHDNEGVFGLQRAFLEAGAKYVIVSLWTVDDEAGKEFMEIFYKEWLDNKNSIPDAFQAAQEDRRKSRGNDIYRWGMFTLIK